jgi:GNAT superfamily N-acetyltransferase
MKNLPDDITLRPALELDADFIYRVVEETMRSYVQQTWGSFSEELTRKSIAESLAAGHYSIVEHGGRDIGAIAIERAPAHVQLEQLYIVPAFQNHRIGTTLVRQLIDESERTGKPLRLRVLAVNPARRLYEREGFVQTATTSERVFFERRPSTAPAKLKSDIGSHAT